MSNNQNVHKMRAQILNLRSAGLACATAIHFFPLCGRPGSCNRKCPEAREALKEIYESMNRFLLLTRAALDAVFQPFPDRWDFMCKPMCEHESADRFLSDHAESLFSDQPRFIRYWGTMDSHQASELGENFSKKEWEVLVAAEAWQNGRIPQITDILAGIERTIAELFDLFDSVLYSGLLGDCNLGQWAKKKKEAARA
jgi:hypothetical protein